MKKKKSKLDESLFNIVFIIKIDNFKYDRKIETCDAIQQKVHKVEKRN